MLVAYVRPATHRMVCACAALNSMYGAVLQGFKSVDVAVLWPKGYTQFHGQHFAIPPCCPTCLVRHRVLQLNHPQHAGCSDLNGCS